MSMATKPIGIPGRVTKQGASAEVPLQQSILGNLRVAQFEAPGYEMSRAANRFYATTKNDTGARTPVTAMPTTTAGWILYNANAAGGRPLVIDFLSAFLTSGTAGIGIALLGAVSTAAIASASIPSQAANHCAPQSFSRGGRSSSAILGVAATVVDPNFCVLAAQAGAAGGIGFGLTVDLAYRSIVVPPGFAFLFDVLSGVGATPKVGVTVGWHEPETDLE